MKNRRAAIAVPPPGLVFDPYTDNVRRDPYPYYRWLLRESPVHRGAHDFWYVSRYPDVELVMADERFGRHEFREHISESVGAGPLREIIERTLFFIDRPDHERLHRLIRGVFSPRVAAQHSNRIARLANGLISSVEARGEIDVISEFANRLPLTVICDILGIPAEGHHRLHAWSAALAGTADPVVSGEAIARGHEAMGEFTAYMQDLLRRRRRAPQADLLSRLAAVGDRQISEEELVAMGIVLVNAGHQTVTHLIGNGTLALLRNPSQLARLRREPALITRAVEECLRYDAPVQQNARVVQAEAVALGGRELMRGDIVIALQGAANRDAAQFDDPDTFDVTRSPNRHISFGRGMRFCLGAPLARSEGRIALEVLCKRLRNMQLAIPERELAYQQSSLFRGLTALPVTFDVA